MHSLTRVVAMLVVVFLTGCAFEGSEHNVTSNVPVDGAAGVHGTVFGGNQPVTGASLQLYSVGASGYGSASTELFTAPLISGPNGTFTFSSYSCPTATTLVYLTATGGNPGLASQNPQNAEIAALGECGNLNSSTYIVINEMTTVAAIWPLAPFMVDLTHIGSSSTNDAGIRNAFLTAAAISNFSVAGAFGTVPANVTLPTAEIYALANILAACVNSTGGSGGDSTPCGNLFSATKVGSVYPTNTAAAALVIAQNPGLNVSTLYGYSLPQAPFQPALSAAPNDWTITISYYNPALVTGSSYISTAIDADQDVWVAYGAPASACQFCSTTNAIFEYGQDLSLLSPATGYTDSSLNGPYGIAFDLSGNLWIADANVDALTEYSSGGSFVKTVTGGGLNGPAAVAIDKNNNVWAANIQAPPYSTYSGASEFTNAGVALSSAAGYTGGGAGYYQNGIAIDSGGNAWIVGSGEGDLAELAQGGTAVSPSGGWGTDIGGGGIAIDSSGNVWMPSCGNGSACGTYAYTSSGQEFSPATTGFTGGGQNDLGASIAVDGANHIWIANSSIFLNGVISYAVGALSELSDAGVPITPSTGYASTPNSSGGGSPAIDNAGNVWWVADDSLYKTVGVAAPVVTPISVATKNSQLGTRP